MPHPMWPATGDPDRLREVLGWPWWGAQTRQQSESGYRAG